MNIRKAASRSAVVLASAIILAAYFWTGYLQRFTPSTEPDVVHEAGLVRVESSFSSRDLDIGAPVFLTITLMNRSAQPLVRPLVAVETPGMRIVAGQASLADIPPGGVSVVRFSLVANDHEGQFRSRITAGWIVNREPFNLVLAPPPVVIRGTLSGLAWIGAAIQAVSKDLALPIIVVILAALFKRADDAEKKKIETEETDAALARAQKEVEDEIARDTRKAAEDTARTDRQRHDDRLRDTWTLLLQKHHENAERYYLPLLSAIGEFRRDYRRFTGSGLESDRRRAFYFLVVLFWRMRRLFNHIGGLYLKNRNGEQVLADCWNIIVQRTDASFGGRTLRDAAIERLTDSDIPPSYARYVKELSGIDPFAGMEVTFAEWHVNVVARKNGDDAERQFVSIGELASLLGFFYDVTKFEVNRPYEYWYGSKPDFPREEVVEFAGLPLFHDDALTELRKHLRVYIDAIAPEYGIESIAWREPF